MAKKKDTSKKSDKYTWGEGDLSDIKMPKKKKTTKKGK